MMVTLLTWIKNFFAAPTFDGDENKAFVARILHVILMILLAAVVIAFCMVISGWVTITNNKLLTFSAIIGPAAIILLLVVLQKGFVRFVAWAFVTFQWFSTVIQIIGSNGVASPALGAFIVTILLAGFLISRRGAVVFGTLSVLSILGVWFLESNHMIPPPILFTELPAKFFMLLMTITIATALLYMVMRTLQNALSESKTYADELEQAVHQKTLAEKKILSLNQQLQQHVAELERFTYTVSHDLKSPLITIGGFVGFLEKDAQVGNVERVSADVIRINEAIVKMQQLLDELLELSRIGRLMNPPEEVSFEIIAREAVELVRGRIEAGGVEVMMAPDLPTIHGDRARLVEVAQNLIDNACKFMGDQPHPRIEIGARQDGDKPMFYVRDNGIGIDPRYHDQVFGLFDKLDPTSEGIGVGLALVRRIIEVHGGKIWIESQLRKGTTFYFTLPLPDNK